MYQNTLNKIALSVLTKPAQIPDYHLMIGSAECLDGLPLLINPTQMVPKMISDNMQKVSQMDETQLQQMLENNLLEINDYSGNNAVLAGMIGGAR